MQQEPKIEDALASGGVLKLRCQNPHCRAETELAAQPFALRLGLRKPLSQIERHMVCPGCGSRRVSLRAG